MYKVRIYRKESTRHDPGILIAYVIVSSDDWNTFDKLCHFHRIDPTCIAERILTETEEIDGYLMWRSNFYSYTSWEVLIKAEWKNTYDLSWVNKLLELSGLSGSVENFIKDIPN